MPEHNWTDNFLAAGFSVEDETTLRASLFHSGCTAALLEDGIVELRAMTVDGCIGKSALVRGSADWSQERLFDALGQILSYLRPHSGPEIDARFGIRLQRAEEIVAESLHTLDFGSPVSDTPSVIDHRYFQRITISMELNCAVKCAAESADSQLIGWMALEHPMPEVKARALQNRACADTILLAVASDESSIPDLLERPDLPPEVFAQMTQAATNRYIRSTTPIEHHLTLIQIALHPSCSDELAIGLLSHVAGAAQDADDLKAMQQSRASFRHLYNRSRTDHTRSAHSSANR